MSLIMGELNQGFWNLKSTNTKTLYPREWLAILTLTLFLLVLSKIAWQAPENRWPQKKGLPFPPSDKQIVVNFSGHLQEEGRYHFNKETTLGDAVEAIKLNEDADVSNLDFTQILKSGDHVKIPGKKNKNKPLRKKGIT